MSDITRSHNFRSAESRFLNGSEIAPRGGSISVPDEVRVCMDEMLFDDGASVLGNDNLWVVIDTGTGAVMRFESDKRERVEPRAWIKAAVDDYLATPNGQRAVQFWIDDAMEGA
jgi:hypothetical protein